jgi:nucleoid associated protein NdpA
MSPTFVGLEIGETIVHGIPQAAVRDRDVAALQLSDVTTDLPDDVLGILQTRLRGVLASDARQIVEDPNTRSPVPTLTRELLIGATGDFVATSQKLAVALQASQTGRSPAGVLLVARATYDCTPVVLMVKLEREDGMRIEFVFDNGRKKFDVTYLSNLLFTGKGTVYKIGILFLDPGDTAALVGWAADKQEPGKKVSKFFREKFLGCHYLEEPKELTRRFQDQGYAWINEKVEDPEKKARYSIGLLAELQSQQKAISLRNFAFTHLEPSDRDSFENYMRNQGLPSATFEKSTELISTRLKKVRLALESGVIVIAPSNAADGGVMSISHMAQDLVRITITDRLVKTSPDGTSGRPPKGTISEEGHDDG